MSVRVAHIVAMSPDRVIGADNALPWHLPEDLRHFKSLTMGKPIVMGRKTWESIGRPLPGRENIVISRQPDFCAAGATVCGSLDEALDKAIAVAERDGVEEVMVIGGAQIYRASLGRCSRIYLTEIDCRIAGDAYYPALPAAEWREISRECYQSSHSEQVSFCFVLLQKIGDF